VIRFCQNKDCLLGQCFFDKTLIVGQSHLQLIG